MHRYHLIGTFDKSIHSVRSKEEAEKSMLRAEIPFISSDDTLRYGLKSTVRELKSQRIIPSETGFDAIIFGIMVYIADMKISRVIQSQDSWSREIWLTVPVSDDRWNNHKHTFEKMLKFLTGDLWSIEFVKRQYKLIDEEKYEKRTDIYKTASLFSGGMDSLIAAINLMEKNHPTLLISHAGEARVRSWQKDLISVLDEKYADIAHGNAYYWTNLDGIELPDADKDMNQRSRSFLFITIALFAMSGTNKCHELLMPENGLIALNVPLDSTRIGSHSTRTTHPFYLELWNQISMDMFGYTIRNPYWNKTKGEMAAECLNKEAFMIAVGQSFSCSSVNSANIRSGKSQHCGHCLPCIIRRAAMHKAFEQRDPSEYMYKNVNELIRNRDAVGEQMRSFQYAINRIKKDPTLKDTLIHKPGPLKMDESYLHELADTYYRGLMEVDKWIHDSLEIENAN